MSDNHSTTTAKKNLYDSHRYDEARRAAVKRSTGHCTICGCRPNWPEAHHWAQDPPLADEVNPSDLTVVCSACHIVCDALRQARKEGIDLDYIARGANDIVRAILRTVVRAGKDVG